MTTPIWDNSRILPEGTSLEPIRKSGFYIIKDPSDGPEAGEFHAIVLNATVAGVRRSYQVVYSVTNGNEYFRTSTALGFSDWLPRASGGGGGAGSAHLVSYNNLTSGLVSNNVQAAIDELLARIEANEGNITAILASISAIETDIGNIETAATTLTDRVTANEADITTINDDITALDAVLDAATTKLATIEEGAEVNPTPEELVAALDGLLGGDDWQQGAGEGATTNITVSHFAETVDVESSTGAPGTINAATDTLAGVMTAADKAKLDGIEAGAEANLVDGDLVTAIDGALASTDWRDPLVTDLSHSRDADSVTVISSNGDDAELPAATTSDAGVMTAADKTKLDGIEAGAQENPTNAEVVAQINAELGSTAWQGAGPGGPATNPSVRVATTGPITIATDLNDGDTLDGITLANDDVVLVKNQAAPEENGLYVVGAVPARHVDFDAYDDLTGILVTVQEGTANADTIWFCTSDDGGTIDIDPLTFIQTEITPTNLSMSRDAVSVTVNSSTGSGAPIPAASDTLAGVMTAADKAKLDTIDATDITISRDATTVTVNSSDGDDDVIPAADASNAGVMTAAMFSKLLGIEEGAEVNQTIEQIVDGIDAFLGDDTWQGGGEGGGGGEPQVVFRATKSANQSISNTTAKVTFPTETVDTDDTYDPALARWTPGITGNVLVGFALQIVRNGGSGNFANWSVFVRKNGSNIYTSPANGLHTQTRSDSFVVPMEPTDYLEIFLQDTSAGTEYNAVVQTGSMFWGVALTGGGGGGGPTNLGVTHNNNTVDITSSTGTPTTINSATGALAGVMSAAAFTKLAAIENNATADMEGDEIVAAITDYLGSADWLEGEGDGTDITVSVEDDVVSVASSTGSSDDIPVATGSSAGVMSMADKAKLDGIAAGANNYTHPNHSGDVTSVADGATTIANDVVTNAKLANVATGTIKGRVTAATGDPEDLSPEQVRTLINVEDGAQVNPSDADIVASVNANLGGTAWQGGGGASAADEVTVDDSGFVNIAGTDVQAVLANIDSLIASGGGGAPTNGFLAYRATNQNVGAEATVKLAADTEVWDAANNFDTANNRWTPGVNGQVVVGMAIDVSGFGFGGGALIYKNGSSIAEVFFPPEDDMGETISILDVCTDTDYYEAFVFNSSGGTDVITGGLADNRFFGYVLGGGGGGGGSGDAEGTTYDNTTSALTAENVQDAIDETVGLVDDLAADVVYHNVEDQGPATGGISHTPKDLGSVSGGATVTIEVGDRQYHELECTGALTLSPGSGQGGTVLWITNGTGAGTKTLTGWDFIEGADFDDTEGSVFRCAIEIVGPHAMIDIRKMVAI